MREREFEHERWMEWGSGVVAYSGFLTSSSLCMKEHDMCAIAMSTREGFEGGGEE